MFNPNASVSDDDLIPAGTLLNASFKVREIKTTKSGTGRYIDTELVVEGPTHTSRRVWDNIQDPFHQGNNPTAREIAQRELVRAGECAGLFDVNDASSYSKYQDLTSFLEALEGKMIQVEIKVEKGDEQFPDKNRYQVLTPNPKAGRAYKKWLTLTGKDGEKTATNSTVGQPVSQGAVQGDQEDKESGDNKIPW